MSQVSDPQLVSSSGISYLNQLAVSPRLDSVDIGPDLDVQPYSPSASPIPSASCLQSRSVGRLLLVTSVLASPFHSSYSEIFLCEKLPCTFFPAVFCARRSASNNTNMKRRYILAQLFGAYLACLVVYVQWKDLITVRTFSIDFEEKKS